MGKKSNYRYEHRRKLETFAAVGDMTVFRNQLNQIIRIGYEEVGESLYEERLSLPRDCQLNKLKE